MCPADDQGTSFGQPRDGTATVDVSVVIVNHNTKALCAQAVAAVYAATHVVSYEVIVVDNSSCAEGGFHDSGELDACVAASAFAATAAATAGRGATLVRVDNHGFGHACNAGAARSRGRYLLFLNPDTILDDGAIDRAAAYIGADGGIGVLGIKTTLPDGTFDHASKRGFPTPFNALCHLLGLDRRFPRCKAFGGYRLAYLDPLETTDIDAVSGSFLLARRGLFDALGGFDEAYFMYGEDIDFCWRAKRAGWRVVYYAGASMRHLKGQSGLHTDSPAVRGHFYGAMEVFFDKHLRHMYGPLMAAAVHAAVRAHRCLDTRRRLGMRRRLGAR